MAIDDRIETADRLEREKRLREQMRPMTYATMKDVDDGEPMLSAASPHEDYPSSSPTHDPLRYESYEQITIPADEPPPPSSQEWNKDEFGQWRCVDDEVTAPTSYVRTTSAVKHDHDKLRFDLIPPEMKIALASAFTAGLKKYEDRNWEKGLEWMRVYRALQSHMTAWEMMEVYDPETGLPHLWHATCCLAMLVTYDLRNTGTDDRPFSATVPREFTLHAMEERYGAPPMDTGSGQQDAHEASPRTDRPRVYETRAPVGSGDVHDGDRSS